MKKFKGYLALTCIYASIVFILSITSDPSKHLAPIYLIYLTKFISPLKGTALEFIYNAGIAIYTHFDKFGHFLFYAGIGLLLYLTLRSSGKTILEKYVYLFSLGIGMLYGTFIELLQAFLPWRSASLLDLTANFLGISTALTILYLNENFNCKIVN
jgi:VanZ family protein